MAKLYETHGIPDDLELRGEPPHYAVVYGEDKYEDVSGYLLRPLTPEDVSRWGRVDRWTSLEAALLLAGVPPDSDKLYVARDNHVRDIHPELVDAVHYSWNYLFEFHRARENLFQFERSSLAPKAPPIDWVNYYDKSINEGRRTRYEPPILGMFLDFLHSEMNLGATDKDPVQNAVEDLSPREMQYEVILAVCAELDYDPQQIPDGGKAKIKSACLTRPRLFTDSGFEHAWKKRPPELFKLANRHKFLRK